LSLTPDQIQAIIRALEARGALLPCPRCGNKSFTVINGYFNHTVRPQTSSVVLEGLSLPTAGVVCNKCGFLSQHALGALGLMTQPSAEPST
jgi:hypothetical protein